MRRSRPSRRAQIDGQIETLLPGWRLAPVVQDLTALRGVDVVIAAAVVAEVGDFARFASARHSMSCLGLVSGERSSGGTARARAITETGSCEVRALLFETAWLYRPRPRIGQWLRRYRKDPSQTAQDIARKAQLRLHSRDRRLTQTRQNRSQVAVTAVARELVGFIWAIALNAENTAMADRPSVVSRPHPAAGGLHAGRWDRFEETPGQEFGAGHPGRISAGRPGSSSMPHHHHGATQDPPNESLSNRRQDPSALQQRIDDEPARPGTMPGE